MAPITGLVIGGHCGEVGQLRGITQLLEVEPGTKHRVSTGEDDDVDGIVGLRIAQSLKETSAQL
jgi:hypothetical protein